MKLHISLLVVAVLALAACKEEQNQTQTDASSATVVDWDRFDNWPRGFFKDEAFLDDITADPSVAAQDNLIIVVDNSTSMLDDSCSNEQGMVVDKTVATRDALTAFIPTVHPEVAISYAEFANGFQTIVPLGTGPGNRMALMSAVAEFDPNGGGTKLGNAMKQVFTVLSEQAMVQGSNGSYRVVFVTDGGAQDGSALTYMLDVADDSPVEVYTAGFCMNRHLLNQPGKTEYVEATATKQLTELLTNATNVEAPAFVAFGAPSADK